MNRIKIITCTKTKTAREFESRPIFKSLEAYDKLGSLDFHVERDCQMGLPAAYNKHINAENGNRILLFVHDDVELEDICLYDKLIASPYDVTGLAGAQEFNKQSPHLTWNNSAQPSSFRGEVAHTKDGQVWTTCFGKTNDRVLTLDGLFLAVNVNTMLEKDIRFDEAFKFHFYDISFSLRCYEKKVTLGVLPIRVVHHGLGDSMNSPEWFASQEIFKQNYCNSPKAE